MSDILRRAIIELEIRLKQGTLNAPDMSAVAKAYEGQTHAAQAATAASEQQAKAVNAAGAAHEEFGRRSSYAYGRGLGGVMEFGRGLALMVADGTQGNEQLLRSIVKVQAGVDVLRGGLLISRLGPELGAAAAVVATGAAAWLLYSQQVAKAKEELKELSAAHAAAIQAETKFQGERSRIAAATNAARTNAQQVPAAKRASEAAELAKIRGHRAESIEDADVNKRSQKAAEKRASDLRYRASILPSNEFEAWAMGMFMHGDRAAIAEKPKDLEKAKLADHGAAAFMAQQKISLESALTGAQREQQILESQRDYDYSLVEARHKSQLEALGGLPSTEGHKGDYHRQQRIGATGGEIGAIGAIGGAAGGLSAMTNLGPLLMAQEGIIGGIRRGQGDTAYETARNSFVGRGDAETRGVQDKWTNFLQGTIAVVEQLQERLANLQKDLDQANATK